MPTRSNDYADRIGGTRNASSKVFGLLAYDQIRSTSLAWFGTTNFLRRREGSVNDER